jgi:hypothetical protein
MVSLVCAAGYILVSIIENVSFVNVISNIYVFGIYFCINVTFFSPYSHLWTKSIMIVSPATNTKMKKLYNKLERFSSKAKN